MIYRGEVLEIRDGWVWVRIPALSGDSAVGPLPTVLPDLTYGEAVLVAALRGRLDDMLVVGRQAEAAYVAPGWLDITGKPSTFAPSAHTHLWADITDKPATFAPSSHTHAYSSLTGIPATFAPSSHTHATTDLTGVLAPGQLPAATSSAAGSLSAADKALIDARSSSAFVSTLMYRDTAGRTNAQSVGISLAPTNANDATRKDYVDSKVAAVTYATLGMVPTSALPPLAVVETTPVASQAEMLALPAQRGDIAIRTDANKTFILATDSPGTLADWKEIMAAGQVLSVAGKTGVVSLVKADVGLGNVDNTSDLAKPISTATQTALNGKAASSHTHAAADIASGTLDPARLPAATSSAAGSMSAADKTAWDARTASSTVSTAVIRNSVGTSAFAYINLDNAPTQTFHAVRKDYVDAMVWDGSRITTGTISDARIANATAALDGLLPKADKALLDAKATLPTPNTLAYRGSAGTLHVVTGTGANDATNKSYVDTAIATANAADQTYGKLRLTGTGDASLTSTTHAFQIGPDNGLNLIIDQNEIMGRNNGVAIETYFAHGVTSGLAPAAASSLTRKDYVDAATADIGTATSSVVNGTLARRSATDGGIQFFRVVSTDTGTPSGSHLVRRDWVDANKRAAEVDSGWVTSGISVAMGTNFALTNYNIRKIDNEVLVDIVVVYSGSTITVGGDGNIGDVVMFTMPSGYRPTGPGWQIEGLRSNQGTAWFGYISTGGAFTLGYGLPGLTLVSGASLTVRARYRTD